MAAFVPDKQLLSQHIEQFLREIEDDFGSPTNSKFQDYIPKCRKNVQSMEEVGRGGVEREGRREGGTERERERGRERERQRERDRETETEIERGGGGSGRKKELDGEKLKENVVV